MSAITEEGQLLNQDLRPLAEVAKGYTCFARGDVLMAKITPCMENGKAALVDKLATELGFGSTEFHVLRPRPGTDARFLFHLIWNPRFRAEAARYMTGSAGQKRVPATYLRDAKVPLIGLTEQVRIADILGKVDAIRHKRNETIALTEELLRSTFLEMFGDPVTNPKNWPTGPLISLADIKGGGTPSRAYPDFFTGKWPWVTAKDFKSDFMLDAEEHVSDEALSSSATQAVPKGTILVVVKSKILLRRLPVSVASVPLCFNQDVKGILPHRKVLTSFLAAHLRLSQGQLLRLARGVNTEGLTLAHLRDFPIMRPPERLIESFDLIEVRSRSVLRRASWALQLSEKLMSSLTTKFLSVPNQPRS
jgi:type I restriction enzyme S subunit